MGEAGKDPVGVCVRLVMEAARGAPGTQRRWVRLGRPGWTRGGGEKQPGLPVRGGALVVLDTVLAVLHGLNAGKFSWPLKELGLCPEGGEKPRENSG